MAKFLVVDDEADLEVMTKQKFRQKIREQKYEFLFAINGRHALEQLERNNNLNLVLSDIHMPEMDGFTLPAKLSKKSYEQIKQFFNCRKTGDINMKNKAEPISICEVIR